MDISEDSQALDKAAADRNMFQQHRAGKLVGQLQQQLCSIRGLNAGMTDLNQEINS